MLITSTIAHQSSLANPENNQNMPTSQPYDCEYLLNNRAQKKRSIHSKIKRI
ncbi:MAG TPA: hypothetical protein VNJ50_04875 [Gelidibacter sp.]|uniref:hypothetical protein n=1 Tax=Gelidibacter sp. TaxID=2018083 RepID=UPI002B59AD85|nr:hypothetical protein [Gelidibacter sp.]HXJ98156.1 hypothetical protein [Gelidibacter sp.]